MAVRPEPNLCDAVFATAVAHEDEVALMYWARSTHFGLPLVLWDWSRGRLRPHVWTAAREALDAAAERMRARYGSAGAWVEGAGLAQQASSHGLPARAVPTWIEVADYWPRLAVASGSYVTAGQVKLVGEAARRAEGKAFGPFDFIGGPRTDDPTIPAFLYGVTLALDESAAVDPGLTQMTALAGAVAQATAMRVLRGG